MLNLENIVASTLDMLGDLVSVCRPECSVRRMSMSRVPCNNSARRSRVMMVDNLPSWR